MVLGDSVFNSQHLVCVFDMLGAQPMPLKVSTLESIDLWRISPKPKPQKDEYDLEDWK